MTKTSANAIDFNTPLTAPAVAITLPSGLFRIHSADCRDLAREVKARHQEIDQLEVGTTLAEFAEYVWGDIAAGNADEDTPEYDAEVRAEFYAATTVLPCTH